MFTLLREQSGRSLLLQQAPSMATSIVIAELFYKFGSFTLECVAFLATWFIADGVIAAIRRS